MGFHCDILELFLIPQNYLLEHGEHVISESQMTFT